MRVRRALAAVVVLSLTGAGGSADAPARMVTCDGQPVQVHTSAARSIIERAYRHRQYKRKDLSTASQHQRIRAHRLCIRVETVRHRLVHYQAVKKQSRRKWRKRMERKAFLAEYRPHSCPPGRLALPCYVARCESGYRWTIHSGMYGLLDSTWRYYAPASWGPNAGAGTKDQQSIVATRVLHDAGPRAWECW